MLLNNKTSLLNLGDCIDLYLKIKNSGLKKVLFKLLKINSSSRVSSKWDNYTTKSDFWIIPEIRAHWNQIITGNEKMEYEEYVSKKYFDKNKSYRLLSIGCGEGKHERNFCNYIQFDRALGIDISAESIKNAQKYALEEKKLIDYVSSDFFKVNFQDEKYDIILFDSSLHHFENINQFLRNTIKPLLEKNGLLIVFEYAGPNRLQWEENQLQKCNEILGKIPSKYKFFPNSKLEKKKVYRPGILRMFAVDPSEAPDSINLVPALHSNFKVLEEKQLGWNIIQPLLKGIAHNFLNKDKETKEIITEILNEENTFLESNNLKSDAVFGVYSHSN
ncbi:Methyltransferase family protein [Flavobacterium sp. 9AF]|uniref:class I SAM-dependent methyltransferase n=1 Tax=Flavobacterium sp. 9AF TaxID=2653142 RepID=UPI0012F3E809|nr:class I SAM-dependent methyltransferase [Flavobacterium sp. 9AF]VXB68421.1 Methyltransferase family protein [Flavobacterium sp. 9AF]